MFSHDEKCHSVGGLQLYVRLTVTVTAFYGDKMHICTILFYLKAPERSYRSSPQYCLQYAFITLERSQINVGVNVRLEPLILLSMGCQSHRRHDMSDVICVCH